MKQLTELMDKAHIAAEEVVTQALLEIAEIDYYLGIEKQFEEFISTETFKPVLDIITKMFDDPKSKLMLTLADDVFGPKTIMPYIKHYTDIIK